jgi:hypothetical protein
LAAQLSDNVNSSASYASFLENVNNKDWAACWCVEASGEGSTYWRTALFAYAVALVICLINMKMYLDIVKKLK